MVKLTSNITQNYDEYVWMALVSFATEILVQVFIHKQNI